METSFRIREATPAEIKAIALFQVLMAEESEGMKLDHATVIQGVSHIFTHPELGFYLVAEAPELAAREVSEGGAPGLLGCMLVQKEWSDWRNRLVLWIHSLYVVPEARKMGIFRGFYRFLRDRVEKDPSLGGLRLYVDRRNVVAQQAYETVGMTNEHYELYEWMKP